MIEGNDPEKLVAIDDPADDGTFGQAACEEVVVGQGAIGDRKRRPGHVHSTTGQGRSEEGCAKETHG